jgi:hypothetical protein
MIEDTHRIKVSSAFSRFLTTLYQFRKAKEAQTIGLAGRAAPSATLVEKSIPTNGLRKSVRGYRLRSFTV